jgi:hypothetical protein
MKLLYAWIALAALIGSGCKRTVDLESNFRTNLNVEFYLNGKLENELTLPAQSSNVSELIIAIHSLSNKWRADFNSYAPGIIVRTTNENLNILPGKVVANLNRNGQLKQYSVQTSPELSQQLSNALQKAPK